MTRSRGEAKLTKVDAKTGTVIVKMQSEGKEVEKTFKLAEDIEYMDSTGKVGYTDIFTSGDMVLIVEREGTITKMKKKDKAEHRQPDLHPGGRPDRLGGGKARQVRCGARIERRGQEVRRAGGARPPLMNKELREITSKKGIALAEGLDQKHQELMDELSKLKG